MIENNIHMNEKMSFLIVDLHKYEFSSCLQICIYSKRGSYSCKKLTFVKTNEIASTFNTFVVTRHHLMIKLEKRRFWVVSFKYELEDEKMGGISLKCIKKRITKINKKREVYNYKFCLLNFLIYYGVKFNTLQVLRLL